jgi:hypothetical protein
MQTHKHTARTYSRQFRGCNIMHPISDWLYSSIFHFPERLFFLTTNVTPLTSEHIARATELFRQNYVTHWGGVHFEKIKFAFLALEFPIWLLVQFIRHLLVCWRSTARQSATAPTKTNASKIATNIHRTQIVKKQKQKKLKPNKCMQDLSFSLRWLWRMPSFGMWRRMAVVSTDVSEKDTGGTFLRNVSSYESHTVSHPRRRPSS